MAETKLEEMLRLRQAPGVAGVSDGPGSCRNEKVFDRPDPLKECMMDAQKMEDAGQLKDPATKQWVDLKIKSLQNQEHRSLDYQKGDHPLDNRHDIA